MRTTHATKNELKFEYSLGGNKLEHTNSTSYLGVELSSDLKWNAHVKKVVAKGNQTLGVL